MREIEDSVVAVGLRVPAFDFAYDFVATLFVFLLELAERWLPLGGLHARLTGRFTFGLLAWGKGLGALGAFLCHVRYAGYPVPPLAGVDGF